MSSNKAIISNRIYFKTTPEHMAELAKLLTYKIKTGAGRYEKIEVVRTYKIIDKNTISIPQQRMDLIPKDYEVLDRRTYSNVTWPAPQLELNNDQKVVYDQVTDTCFVNALVGWGKTFTALYIAHKLGQKTLVVVHTSMLRDQWVKEVKKLFGIDAGVIGGGHFNIEDTPIVIANIQTLTKMANNLSKEFGTVIIDEAHHTPAATFTNTLDLLNCRYRIALSGTMERKDGKHCLFKDFFGFTVYRPPKNNTVNPRVKIIKTGKKLLQGVHYAKKINSLLEDEEYLEFIVATAKVQAIHGHKVLIVSDRTEFLRKVSARLGPRCILMIGATAHESERIRMEKGLENGSLDYVAGSKQIFAEGISVNILSCLLLTTPVGSLPLLEQLIGRIMRIHEGKPDPIVIDMNFLGINENKQNRLRLSFYLLKGWDIITV